MNDRYLFKAKNFATGNWHKGFLVDVSENKCTILDNDSYWACNSETLCQCTGLKDKNGNLIWENDICKYDERAKFTVKFGVYTEFTNKRHLGYYAEWEDKWDGLYGADLGYWHDEVEVIGSIIDNPELLEVE